MPAKKIFLLCALILGACSSPEICRTRQGLHEWNEYRWEPGNTDLSIRDNTGSKEYGKYFDEVVEDWNNLGTALYLVEDGGTEIDVVMVEGEEWLGLAEVWLSADSGNVTRVRVSLNKTLLENYSPVGKRHVLCQEIGHALGLFHIEGNTCMDDCSKYAPNSAEKKRCVEDEAKIGPNEHDAEQLILMYGEYTDNCS